MRAGALALALVAPALAAADGPRVAFAVEGALARYPQAPSLAVGAAGSMRVGPVEATGTYDGAARRPAGEAGFGAAWLLGAGAAIDASPLVSLHADAVAGGYRVRLRDYALGGWREVTEPAVGGRAGVRLHPDARLPPRGRFGVWPLAGAWLTVLRVEPGADRLRGARWGGVTVAVTITLGAELTGPGPRRATAAP